MSDDKKKAVIIGAFVALIIILFLVFSRRGKTTVIKSDEAGNYMLPGMTLNLGDLIVPDLAQIVPNPFSYYSAISSCGCRAH